MKIERLCMKFFKLLEKKQIVQSLKSWKWCHCPNVFGLILFTVVSTKLILKYFLIFFLFLPFWKINIIYNKSNAWLSLGSDYKTWAHNQQLLPTCLKSSSHRWNKVLETDFGPYWSDNITQVLRKYPPHHYTIIIRLSHSYKDGWIHVFMFTPDSDPIIQMLHLKLRLIRPFCCPILVILGPLYPQFSW